jgi:hypothetical protein
MTMAGPRARVREVLRGGALVELSSLPAGARVLDAVMGAAGATSLDGAFIAGAGGAALVPVIARSGMRGMLRLAPTDTTGDPAPVADTLERLRVAGVTVAPRLEARGHDAGASWTVEHALPGRRPTELTPRLAEQIASACARFPTDDGPPTAPADDLARIATCMPDRSTALGVVPRAVENGLAGLPGILRHGDLWTGNVLVDRGTLSGLVDWDACHPAGAPGADILQLVAVEARRRARQSLGDAFLARPWRSSTFTSVAAAYWAACGLHPGPEALDALGAAWWATEVSGTLKRFPQRADDAQWLDANVDPVLARFA